MATSQQSFHIGRNRAESAGILLEEGRQGMNAKRKATEAAQIKDTAKISIFLCMAIGSDEKSTTGEDLGKGGAR